MDESLRAHTSISRGVASLLLLVVLSTSLLACETQPDEATAPVAEDAAAALSPEAGDEAIARHLLDAGTRAAPTRALVRAFPTLDRARAYRIQLAALAAQEADGAELAGWKMGGTRVTDPAAAPDPLFGYSLNAHVYREGTPVSMDHFAGQAPLAEAEIAIWIGKDLPGPVVSREELIDAIAGVGGAIELIAPRLRPADDAHPEALTTEHALADNLSHAGAVLGQRRVPLDAIVLDEETAVIEVNGEEKARGTARDIMGTAGDPVDAVLWLANELPRHGRHLRAGQYVITGSMYDNPTLAPGDSARVTFSTLGTVGVALEPSPPRAAP